MLFLNALWLAFEVSMNDEELLSNADVGFQLGEHLFCAYFVAELVVRFMAFRRTRGALKDTWFLFDAMIGFTMVLETWIFSIIVEVMGSATSNLGPTSVLKILKFVRLSRVARLGRLMRSFPEIVIILGSIKIASRTLLPIVLILVGIVYVFAIMLTQLCKGTHLQQDLFQNVPTAMYSLLLKGVLPDWAPVLNSLGAVNPFYAILYMLFILIVIFVLLNILVGALVQVVSAVACLEHESNDMKDVKQEVQIFLKKAGLDTNGGISKHKLNEALQSTKAAKALRKACVDVQALEEKLESKPSLTAEELLDAILDLRGKQPAKLQDLTEFRRCLHADIQRLEGRLVAYLGTDLSKASNAVTACSTSRV
jgi:hypothetical protein